MYLQNQETMMIDNHNTFGWSYSVYNAHVYEHVNKLTYK